jgi:antitoxin (DNA-binding transcriptional repressor) of toxin-antitoxin stability system
MREIGAFEAKNRLGELLDWVEAGEESSLPDAVEPSPRVVPPNAIVDRERALGAAARTRAPRRGVTLGGMKAKDLINEGRP